LRNFIDGVLHVTGKGGRQRIVPVHPTLAEHLAAELELRRQGRTGSGRRLAADRISPDDYLFPGQERGTHAAPWVVGDALADLLGDAWTAHTLRHRFASRAYAATRDIRAVQEMLGHSSPQTTARYTAVPDNAMRDAVLAI
jgi:integrase